MAANGTSGFLPVVSAFETLTKTTTAPATIAVTVVVGLLLLLHSLGPRVDAREPPVVKPRIPFIGHVLGMMRQQAQYHVALQRATGKPIATLPMLTGKMYAVWDPHLIAAGLRNKALSTTPHMKAVTPAVTGLSAPMVDMLGSPAGDHLVDRIMLHAIPPSFKGASAQHLTATALAGLARELSALARAENPPALPTTIPNTWLWLRHLLTTTTGPALYGPADPFAQHAPHAEAALWDFEKALLALSVGLPTRAGRRARAALVRALEPYYAARRDEDAAASAFVRNRAAEFRRAGMGADDVARLEVMLPFAALANTVPLLFWLVGFVFSRRELVHALREEVEAALVVGRTEDAEAGGGGGGATVTLRTGPAVEERCPRLMSCYRETLRYTVHQVITRTAMQDTVLVARDGREYLLKEGSVVQMSIGASHAQAEFWGEDVDEFKPDRFLSQSQGGHKGGSDGGDGPGSTRAMRAALQPFGGGTHLCPGRHFAFAEIMAVMSTLLLGFEIEPLGGDWTLPPFATRSLIDAVTKPAKHGEGFGIEIRRRPGWEDVQWKFEL